MELAAQPFFLLAEQLHIGYSPHSNSGEFIVMDRIEMSREQRFGNH